MQPLMSLEGVACSSCSSKTTPLCHDTDGSLVCLPGFGCRERLSLEPVLGPPAFVVQNARRPGPKAAQPAPAPKATARVKGR